jgi:hypothetical protein
MRNCRVSIVPGSSVEQSDAPAARDRSERVRARCLAIRLEGLEVHACEGADDFEVAELLLTNIHEEVFALGGRRG